MKKTLLTLLILVLTSTNAFSYNRAKCGNDDPTEMLIFKGETKSTTNQGVSSVDWIKFTGNTISAIDGDGNEETRRCLSGEKVMEFDSFYLYCFCYNFN